jgi:hypothetical protein
MPFRRHATDYALRTVHVRTRDFRLGRRQGIDEEIWGGHDAQPPDAARTTVVTPVRLGGGQRLRLMLQRLLLVVMVVVMMMQHCQPRPVRLRPQYATIATSFVTGVGNHVTSGHVIVVVVIERVLLQPVDGTGSTPVRRRLSLPVGCGSLKDNIIGTQTIIIRKN